MNNTSLSRKPSRLEPRCLKLLVSLGLGLAPLLAFADVRFSSDWNTARTCTGSARNMAEVAEIQQGLRPRPVCTVTESGHAAQATAQSAMARSAAIDIRKPTQRDFEQFLGFKLQLDGQPHYFEPVGFMTPGRPDEVCTPSPFKGQPTYRCNEGQRHTVDCHVLIFNERFEEVGYQRIAVNEPYLFYCNAVPAVGVGDASRNVVLATIQYFPIDEHHASNLGEVGQGWRRMTVALRLTRQDDGRVRIEQDDRCLGNPNRIDTIPDAKRLLRQCMTHRP